MRMRMKSCLLTCCAVMSFTAFAVPPLFEKGASEWSVVSGTNVVERYAAKEFCRAVKIMSGAELAVAERVTEGRPTVVIRSGESAPDAKGELCVNRLEGDRLVLAGNTPRAALYAMYAFLRRELGARWLWPQPDGEFLPKHDRFSIPAKLDWRYEPSYRFRCFHTCGDARDDEHEFLVWMARNGMNLHWRGVNKDNVELGFINQDMGHNLTFSKAEKKKYFPEHPEYFALRDGERTMANICLSNPDVVRLVAERLAKREHKKRFPAEWLMISLPDNVAYCQCPECAKDDTSTAFFRFAGKVARALKEECPGLKVETLAYQGYRKMPNCPLTDFDRILFCSHWRCNVHPYADRTCGANKSELAAMAPWTASPGLPVLGDYGYIFDVFSKNKGALPIYSLIAEQLRVGKEHGYDYFHQEIGLSRRNWKTGEKRPLAQCQDIMQYVGLHEFATLTWDLSVSRDAWLVDFCRTAYGPAAAPMRRYFDTLENAWTNRTTHIGILRDSLGTVESFMTPTCVQSARAALAESIEALKGADPRYAANVRRESAQLDIWEEILALKKGNAALFVLPRRTEVAAIADDVCKPLPLYDGQGHLSGAKARMSWSDKAVTVELLDLPPAVAAGKVSVELRDGKTPEIFTFVLKDGQRSQSKIGELGVDDPTWKPKAWTALAEEGVVRFTIPFADLGRTPSVGDRWMATLAATDGHETRKLPVKAESAAEMFFSGALKTGIKVLRWTGKPERDDLRNEAWRTAGLKAGYDYVFGSRINVLEGDSAATDVFWFADTDPQHVTDDFWGQLGEFVKGGKTAVFVGYGEVPFEKIFKGVKVGKESFDYGKGRVILLAEPPADEIAFLKGM